MSALLLGSAVSGVSYKSVKAADAIALSAVTDTPVMNPGDLITVKVNANYVPELTAFDGVVLEYDTETVSPEDIIPGSEIADSFVFSEEYGESNITVSAVNPSLDAESEGNEEANTTDTFSSEDEVTLFEATFRIKSDAPGGDIRFWISDAIGFRNGEEETYDVYVDSGTTVTIEASISSDATLSQLKIDDVSIAPDFQPNVFEYTASVGKDIASVVVTAIPENIGAGVTISGENDLQYGENTVVVNVLAQDGVTTQTYSILVTRQQDYVPENAMVVDKAGKVYNCVDMPQSVLLPDNFSECTVQIGDFTIPGYQTPGLASYLIYLYDGETSPGFYFYNPVNETVTAYEPTNTIILTGTVLMSREIPSTVKTPVGFTESSLEVNGSTLTGYTDSEGAFICYMVDENGNGGFYEYNAGTGSFIGYTPQEENNERIYKILFYVFVSFSILESGMIIIIVVVLRRIKYEKVNPRPKRV